MHYQLFNPKLFLENARQILTIYVYNGPHQTKRTSKMTTSKFLFAYFVTFIWALVSVFTIFSIAYFIVGYFMGHYQLYSVEVILSIVAGLTSPYMFYSAWIDLTSELARMHRKHRRAYRLVSRDK